MKKTAHDSGESPRRRLSRVHLATVLIGGTTLLILVAVGSVLWVTLTSATQNTFELLGERATRTLDTLEVQIDSQLQPVTEAVEGFARQFADGRLDVTANRQRIVDTFSGFLTSHPQVRAAVYVTTDNRGVTLARVEGYPVEIPETPVSNQRRLFALSLAQKSDGPFWAAPIWIEEVGQAVVTYIAPVRRGDKLIGIVVAPITLTRVSEFLGQLEQEQEMSAFLLHNHDRVLAHPALKQSDFRATGSVTENPLPHIGDLDEPAFRLLAGGGEEAVLVLEYAANVSNALVDDDNIVIMRDTLKYGPELWTMGVALKRAIVSQEIARLINTAIVGLVILAIAVVLGIVFSRHLNKQIGRLVTTAGAMTRLDAAAAPEVPDSRIRELSEAARAFNRMISALRIFETYVPKQLVLRIMRSGETVQATEERVLTIMFTDIRGFSTLAEHMDAGEIAGLLNDHFNMLAEPIEAEGGTVDKYIGDAIMAFWGAPEDMPDHAARALRAGAEIQRRIRADNLRRKRTGEPPLAVRVGIHTGAVVVGNIGSRNRINYTIVGDAVNIASRIDSIAKDLSTDEDCIVLASGDTLNLAGGGAVSSCTTTPLGERQIRGREGTISIFRLDADAADG